MTETAPADHPTSAQSPDPTNSELQQQLQAAVAERDSNRERWLRAQADLENYRKRSQREADDERRFRVLPFVRDMLPAIDNLQRAVDAARSSNDPSQLMQGVQLVIKQFEDLLSSYSVVPVKTVGQPFDPNVHQALQQVATNAHPPLTVLEEFQRGYTLHDRVVRPSTVIVAAPLPADSADAAAESKSEPSGT